MVFGHSGNLCFFIKLGVQLGVSLLHRVEFYLSLVEHTVDPVELLGQLTLSLRLASGMHLGQNPPSSLVKHFLELFLSSSALF